MTPQEQRESELLDELLRLHPDIESDGVDACRAGFEAFRGLYLRIAESHRDIRQGQFALLGVVNHSYCLLLGGIDALLDGNAHLLSAAARSLLETVGLLRYVESRPNKLPRMLGEGISAGKLRNAAKEEIPSLAEEIDRLDAIVHPGKTSVFAGIRVRNWETREAEFVLGVHTLSTAQFTSELLFLLNIALGIAKVLERLLAKQPEILRVGKPAIDERLW